MDAVLLSPVNPFCPQDGHRLAVLSDLRALLDNRLDVGLIAFTYGDDKDSIENLCPWIKIQAAEGGFAARFVRGVVKRLPPSAERLYHPSARQAVISALRQWLPQVVIVDDASVAGYIPEIRRIVPQAKIILRSHNVMHDVRQKQLSGVHGPTRPAIALDCRRYIELERTAVLSSDQHWAITEGDAQRMAELYGRPAECLTVSIPLEQYSRLPSDQGQSNGFVHVGVLDFRRRGDLSHFLSTHWPRILEADSQASLMLAGELTGDVIPGPNVTYAGRVKSDAETYGKFRFAINFQSSPGGLKLKTLTSLAAGRTLLSTREGVEGIGVKSGRDFFEMDDFLGREDLRSLLNDVRATQAVADSGRNYVHSHHSRSAVAKRMITLLETN